MLYLHAVADKFRVSPSSAAAIDYVVDWQEWDKTTGAIADMGTEKGTLSGSAVDILAGVATSNRVRSIKECSFRNRDATLGGDVKLIRRFTGPADYELIQQTLLPGDTWEYLESIGFVLVKASSVRSGLKNVSTADQAIGASATAYLTGSAILLPSNLVAGMVLRWRLHIAKTGAATAQEVLAIRFGTGGSTSDTARNSFTLDVETAAADEMVIDIQAVIRGPIGATCVVQASIVADNNLSTTGFSTTARKAQVQAVTSAAFDITPAGTIAGLTLVTGASHAITVRAVAAELLAVGA